MLTFLYTLSILLMMLVPVFLAVALRRRFTTPWFLFCAGILTFTVSQIVHIPLNSWLANIGILPKPGTENSIPLWQTSLVLGLTAGLCEELARVGGYAILKRYRAFADGMMMGLGHGGIESMVFGGVQAAAAVSGLLLYKAQDLTTLNLTTAQMATLEEQINLVFHSPWMAFLPLIERLIAIAMQVVFSMLIWKAFTSRNAWYVILAIAYHTAVDAGAVYLAGTTQNAWLIEVAFFIALLPGVIWLARIFPRERITPTPLRSELTIFRLALQKELMEQWRSRKVLVVLAVFGAFGMMSPLLAYFTPQMLRLVPEAELFAELIPTPTIADALAQYIKNISQFGFILAILLGMGAVAGEKERGTASLILSKPMTRWAFVTSKFTAQAVVYLAGFFLATIGAFFYTWVLFGAFNQVSLVSISFLLFLWLLPYVIVTLNGSVIARTTGAAAGIALLGAILLLLSSSLPQINVFLPGALVGWAGQIALSVTTQAGSPTPGIMAANGGALAACVVLTIIGLISAIAIFERQEP